MQTAVSRIVIVGGGTAGWLAACRLAAAVRPGAALSVTLIEAPDIPTIGVGEGTWPTMRATLAAIGIDEGDFLLACDASFKQGSRFDGWATGAADDSYHHPFTPPPAGDPAALVAAWQALPGEVPFAEAAGVQPRVARHGLAPRQRAMPGYAGALNYAYHLDAGKFAALLARHAVERLNVGHVRDTVIAVDRDDRGGIAAVRTRDNGAIAGDLFIDATGHAALLIGGALAVPLVDRSHQLFNDSALVAQVPVAPDSPIAAQTNATAHEAGWIWDIGLPTRRGIGCVYSSAHLGDEAAADVMARYLAQAAPGTPAPSLRKLSFRSAHRARFWVGNCIAIGLSAGFVEPLEASAIVMIELSLDALIDRFPVSRDDMPPLARRFDALFAYRWERIVEFLKLHYVPSRRGEPYWRDHRDPASIPDRLRENLQLWERHPPAEADFAGVDEIFPAASYQYVLYGMTRPAAIVPPVGAPHGDMAARLAQLAERGRGLMQGLPTIRAYLDALAADASPPRLESYR